MRKICSICGEDKPLNDYYTYDGYTHKVCKICHSTRCVAWRKTESGKVSVAASDRSETGKERYRRYRQTDKYQATQDRYHKSKKGKTVARKYCISSRKLHPDRTRAYSAVQIAVKNGKLPKASTLKCSAQLDNCTGNAMEYHHYNGYNKMHALDVIPVCSTCHKALDKINTEPRRVDGA